MKIPFFRTRSRSQVLMPRTWTFLSPWLMEIFRLWGVGGGDELKPLQSSAGHILFSTAVSLGPGSAQPRPTNPATKAHPFAPTPPPARSPASLLSSSKLEIHFETHGPQRVKHSVKVIHPLSRGGRSSRSLTQCPI